MKSHKNFLKTLLPDVRVEAVSFWKCIKGSDIVSLGVTVFRKGDASEKKIVPVLKVKSRDGLVTVDDEPEPKYGALISLVS